jgi:protein-disulfide isomerase
MKINKVVLGGIAAGLVVVFVAATNWYRGQEATTASDVAEAGAALLVRPHSPTLGPDDATVTLVEFFDPECESCRAMYPVVKQVMAEFEGRVKLVIRYMPLHQNSAYAASLLEAARAQNRYWEFLDIVMARQPEWASHHAPRPELLITYAPPAGLDAEQLRMAAGDPQIRARIQQDQSDGVALGADKTPTFFVNGKPLMQLGYMPLRAAIAEELQ